MRDRLEELYSRISGARSKFKQGNREPIDTLIIDMCNEIEYFLSERKRVLSSVDDKDSFQKIAFKKDVMGSYSIYIKDLKSEVKKLRKTLDNIK